ncbi:MAG: PAS domain S-box protein [Haloarculaceae archaeon]
MAIESFLPESIRSRYSLKLLGVALLIVLVITAISAVTVIDVADTVRDEQLNSMEANAELEANALAQWIEGKQQTVRVLSSHRGLDPDNPAQTGAVLEAEREDLSAEAATLSLVERSPETYSEGRNETIVASTEPTYVDRPLSVTDVDWKPTVGYNFESETDVILSWVYTDDGDPFVAVASPTPDGDHVLFAEYRTSVRAEEFTSVIEGTKTQVLGGFTAFVLFDENESKVITRYKGDRENTTIGSRILEADPTIELNGSVLTDTSVKGYHSVPGEKIDWVVVKEAPRSNALALTDYVQSGFAVLVGVTLLGFLLIGVVIQRGPIRSIQRLATQASAISEGELDVEIEDEGRVDEIGDVRAAFRDTKSYIETIASQAEALSRRAFDDEAFEREIPGRIGESIETMQADLQQFIADLEAERERYSTLVEQSSDGVAVVQDGEYAFVNDRFAEISGYDRETLTGMGYDELVGGDHYEQIYRRTEQLFAGDISSIQLELDIETRAGPRRRVEAVGSKIDHDGEPAVLVNTRDITERRRRERAVESLQAATERMQTDETPPAVARTAVEAASDVLGLPIAGCWFHDANGQRLEPVAATDDAREAGIMATLSPSSTEYGAFESGTVTSHTSEAGDATDALETGVLLPLGDHGLLVAGDVEPAPTDGVVLDIAEVLAEHTETALDRAERAQSVRESERRFRLIADRIDEVIVLTTGDRSKVLYVNPAYDDVWGRPREELYRDPAAHREAIDDADRGRVDSEIDGMYAEIDEGTPDDSYTFEYRITRPDGDVRWVSDVVYPVELDDGGRRCIRIVEDVTDRKRREQRLEVFNRILRHNLRNRLDVIKSNAEQLADRIGGDHATAVLSAADRLATIGNRARRIDRLMSSDRRPTTVDLTEVIEETLADVDSDGADVCVRTDLPQSATLRTDAETLRAALESPLDNAVSYAESTVEVAVEPAPERYTVVISDDGPGIPDAELDSLEAGTETDLRHSRGLGLWQLTWAVEKLNGDLSFDTDSGTTVRITVPDLGDDDAH